MTAAYGFFAAFLGFFGFVCTAWCAKTLALHWMTLFENVWDSWKAGRPHARRAHLTFFVSLTLIIWLLTVGMCSQNVIVFWSLMNLSPQWGALERFIYAVMDTFLLVHILSGIIFLGFSLRSILDNRQMMRDLLMICRFSRGNYYSLTHVEEQRPVTEEPAGKQERVASLIALETYRLLLEGQHPWQQYAEEVARRTATNKLAEEEETSQEVQAGSDILHGFDDDDNSMRAPCHAADTSPTLDSDGEQTDPTPTFTFDTVKEHRGIRRDTFPLDSDHLRNDSDTESCSTCCSTHKNSLPSTIPALHREPLTPTSPTQSISTDFFSSIASNADAEVADAQTVWNPSRRRNQDQHVTDYAGLVLINPGYEGRCEVVKSSERAGSVQASIHDSMGAWSSFSNSTTTDLGGGSVQTHISPEDTAQEDYRHIPIVMRDNEASLETISDDPNEGLVLPLQRFAARDAMQAGQMNSVREDSAHLMEREERRPSNNCYEPGLPTMADIIAELPDLGPRVRHPRLRNLLAEERSSSPYPPRQLTTVPTRIPSPLAVSTSLSLTGASGPMLSPPQLQPEWYYAASTRLPNGNDAN